MYNYLNSVTEDAKNAIKDRHTAAEIAEALETSSGRQEFAERLSEELWTDDSVTGNGSGSYTFNTYQAEENLAHNWELMQEVADEFGIDAKISDAYEHGAEWWDVSIRCYLLSQAISTALDEIEAEA